MTLTEKYIELVQAVNAAKTCDEHRDASQRLAGFGEAVTLLKGDVAHGRLILAADGYYLDQGIDRPMCGGVWLDWQPDETAQAMEEAR